MRQILEIEEREREETREEEKRDGIGYQKKICAKESKKIKNITLQNVG